MSSPAPLEEGRDATPGAGFAIEFSGLQVEVVLQPLAPGVEVPSAAAILLALRSSPLKQVDRAALERAVEEWGATTSLMRVIVGETPLPPRATAPCVIVLSSDRLAAYAVPVPADLEPSPAGIEQAQDTDETPAGEAPAAETPQVTASLLAALLDDAGVTACRLDEVIAEFGAGAPLLDVTCVALGSRPSAGLDATLEYHFDEPAEIVPVLREDGSVDHHAANAHRFVDEGALLVTRHAPQPGLPGYDLAGRVTPPTPAKDIELTRIAGKHTTVVDDTLLAAAAGLPLRDASGAVEVRPVFEVRGDLDYSVGNIDFPGDVIVRGDVKSGFTIVARGSVVVGGLVEGASISAGGDVALSGVVGERQTYLQVGGDLTASYLHTTEAHVTGSITVASEIMNSALIATRVHTGPRGRIVGGQVIAQTEVDTGTLGSREARPTRVRVTSAEPEAVVRARKAVFPGVVVEVSGGRRAIEEESPPASYWDAGGAIVSLHADIEVAEAVAAIAPAEEIEDASTTEGEAPAAAAA